MQRGWKLRDVAIPLGVTEATLSRWERGLQTVPHSSQSAWTRLLTGQPATEPPSAAPRRRPKGILARLAELFLADVKAGLNGWQAGWRELSDLNLTAQDLAGLEAETERDSNGRLRIRFDSRLESVQQAQNILGYRNTLQAEQRKLIPAIDQLVSPLLEQVAHGLFAGAVLLAGLADMIAASASSLEGARTLLDGDPTSLVDAPTGAAISILDAVGVSFDVDALPTLGLQDLVFRDNRPDLIAGARATAAEIGMDRTAKKLGVIAVKAVGAAWAMNRRLTLAGIAVRTDEGSRYLGDVFWKGMAIRRDEVNLTWLRVMSEEFEPQGEKEQLGMLLWSWPEVL